MRNDKKMMMMIMIDKKIFKDDVKFYRSLN